MCKTIFDIMGRPFSPVRVALDSQTHALKGQIVRLSLFLFCPTPSPSLPLSPSPPSFSLMSLCAFGVCTATMCFLLRTMLKMLKMQDQTFRIIITLMVITANGEAEET